MNGFGELGEYSRRLRPLEHGERVWGYRRKWKVEYRLEKQEAKTTRQKMSLVVRIFRAV